MWSRTFSVAVGDTSSSSSIPSQSKECHWTTYKITPKLYSISPDASTLILSDFSHCNLKSIHISLSHMMVTTDNHRQKTYLWIWQQASISWCFEKECRNQFQMLNNQIIHTEIRLDSSSIRSMFRYHHWKIVECHQLWDIFCDIFNLPLEQQSFLPVLGATESP